jgi:hypothetical protein
MKFFSFGKLGTVALRQQRTVNLAFGVVWIGLSMSNLNFASVSPWPAVAMVLLGLGYLTRTFFAQRELRRRKQATATADQ